MEDQNDNIQFLIINSGLFINLVHDLCTRNSLKLKVGVSWQIVQYNYTSAYIQYTCIAITKNYTNKSDTCTYTVGLQVSHQKLLLFLVSILLQFL